MKICWDNLKNLRYRPRAGEWCSEYTTYVYKENCIFCGGPFLAQQFSTGKFCSNKCRYAFKVGEGHQSYGNIHSKETRKKISKKVRGENSPWWGRKHTEETKKRMSKTRKVYWTFDSYQQIQKIAMHVKPNKPETLLNNLLQDMFPEEYKYVGDFQFWLGGKNPDFMNINGQKKLIEMFGDYWHSEKIWQIPEDEHEQDRINHFKKFGFDTLIVWENELKDIDKVTNRIIEFHEDIPCH